MDPLNKMFQKPSINVTVGGQTGVENGQAGVVIDQAGVERGQMSEVRVWQNHHDNRKAVNQTRGKYQRIFSSCNLSLEMGEIYPLLGPGQPQQL